MTGLMLIMLCYYRDIKSSSMLPQHAIGFQQLGKGFHGYQTDTAYKRNIFGWSNPLIQYSIACLNGRYFRMH